MNVPHLESSATLDQNRRISEALSAQNIPHQLVLNSWEEPLAVHLPAFLPADEVEPYALQASRYPGPSEERVPILDRLGDLLPAGAKSRMFYPEAIGSLLSTVVQAAMDRPDATPRRMLSVEAGNVETYPHIDFPTSKENPENDIVGLNVHLTLQGSATARFSLIREFAQVDAKNQIIKDALSAGPQSNEAAIKAHRRYVSTHTLPELYVPFMEEATDPITLEAGDIVIFQARTHRSRDLLPTVHHFVTRTLPRWITVFSPKVNPPPVK